MPRTCGTRREHLQNSLGLVHHRVMRIRMMEGLVCGVLLCISLRSKADLVGDVRAQLARNSFFAAEGELRGYKAQHGVTPEYVEALSWMARGAAAMKQWEQASSFAGETRTLCEQQLAKRKLDADAHLPVALGAAYEVLAQSTAERGHQAEAVRLLRSALARYGTTSIAPRLQKNLNLLALVGHAAPPLQSADYQIGRASCRGRA